MIMSVTYTCIGSESDKINVPAISGRDTIAVLVDGYSLKLVEDPPTDDQVLVDHTNGDITIGYIPRRGLVITAIYVNRDQSNTTIPIDTNLNDFFTADFSTTDFY